MAKRDYYEVLGLTKSATDKDIKEAYRKLAKKYHPDMNKAKDAADRFKEVNEAYEILKDPEKKAAYDQYGFAGVDPNQGFSGFGGAGSGGGFSGFGNMDDLGDIFEQFMGGRGGGFSGFDFGGGSSRSSRNTGPIKGANRYMYMDIDFLDAVHGVDKTVNISVDKKCSNCDGTGAASKTDITKCPTCNGSGRVTQNSRTPFGVIKNVVACPDCNGTGNKIKNKCKYCGGAGYTTVKEEKIVTIPAGISSGQQVRIAGYGERGQNGGPNGDLLIEIRVRPHKFFIRDGNNIYIKVPISAVDATLGCKIDVPTPHGDVELSIPAGTQPNQKLRIKGYGVKDLRGKGVGDQYVEVEVKVPTKLTKEEKDLYTKLKESQSTVYDKFKKTFK